MHPLEALNESELGRLTRVADRLLNTRHLLALGHRPSQLRAGFGIEFLDFREFSAGDDIRDIDWRTTARSRHPQIRRYSDEVAADWFIVLDCSASMLFGDGKKWQLALQATAALAYLLIHLGNRVSVMLFSNKIEQMVQLGRGNSHYASILQMLRRFEPAKSGGGSDLRSCVFRIKRHSPVFVISDFLATDAMQNGLNALSIRGDRLHALQILSEFDQQLPAEHSVNFRDVETAESITVELNGDEREQHQLAFTHFRDTLVNYCQKQHIRFSTHMSNENWKSVLIDHLMNRNSQP